MPASETEAAVLGPHTRHLAPAITLRRATFRSPFSRSRNRCWPRGRPERRLQETAVRTPHVEPNTLPFQQFHVLFHSLFKVLFIFPSQYLFAIGLSPIFSLRWNLPPAWSCIPKQLDSSAGPQKLRAAPYGALTLSGTLFQGTWTPRSTETPAYTLQLVPKHDFKSELLPLHSPLLGQSLLVSFPPLIDMLKFSGYSYLI